MRSAKASAVLLGACLLLAGAARAEDKGLVEQAREHAREGVRELRDAKRDAKQKLHDAEQKLKDAEQKLKGAAADAKEAAEQAVSEAKAAVERAKAEANAAGEKAKDTAAELKADVAEAAAKARTEAEGAADEAGETVRELEAKAHAMVRGVSGAAGDARRREARRATWHKLADHVRRPRDVPPSVREELRRHAQRTARLERIRALANEKKEPALSERAEKLIARENERHERKLALLLARTRGERDKPPAEDEDQEPAEEPAEEEEEQP